MQVRLRLGVFDPAANQPYLTLGPNDICTPASKQLALDAAHQGLTLLKNDGNTLPLAKGAIKNLAVIGPNANNPGVMQVRGSRIAVGALARAQLTHISSTHVYQTSSPLPPREWSSHT